MFVEEKPARILQPQPGGMWMIQPLMKAVSDSARLRLRKLEDDRFS